MNLTFEQWDEVQRRVAEGRGAWGLGDQRDPLPWENQGAAASDGESGSRATLAQG